MEQSNILGINTNNVKVDNNYKIDCNDLESKLKSIYPTQAMIIFNNPCNPTGVIYTVDEIYKLSNIFKKYGTIVLNDCIYKDLVHTKYDNIYGDITKYYDNTIDSNSLSKTFACGGYRLGWLKFPEHDKLDSLFSAATSCASSIYSCPTLSLQYVAAKALTFPEEIKENIKFQKNMLQNIGEYLYDKLSQLSITCSIPQGGWYIWLDFDNYKLELNNLNINNSNDLAVYLVKNLGIVIVPGYAFGVDGLTCRYSYVDIDIDIENKTYDYTRIKQFLDVLSKWLDTI